MPYYVAESFDLLYPDAKSLRAVEDQANLHARQSPRAISSGIG